MARCPWRFLAAPLGLLFAPCFAKDIVFFHDCDTGSPFACMARDAAVRLRVTYPSHNITEPILPNYDCKAYLPGKTFDIVVAVGFGFTDCAADAANHPATWFITIDFCDFSGPNILCALFDQGQVSYVVGYLAGLVTKTKVVASVGGMPVTPVKALYNGFRLGVEASCPDCRVEGDMVHSFAHVAGGNASANELVLKRGADVVFGCGGYTGSVAITGAAQLGAMVIGVDVDEFASTFASEPAFSVRSRVMTSAGKKVDVSVEKALPLVLNVPTGGVIEGVSGGVLMLDYANGGVGISDCHLSCGLVGTATWDRARRVERDLASGLVKVTLNADGTIALPEGEANSFVAMPFAGRAPQPRVQHAMASFSSAWQTRVAVFGGAGNNGPLGDLWLYTVDLGTWMSSDTGITFGTQPPPLIKSCAVALGESVVIFGGRTQDSKQSSLVYTFTDEPDFLGFGDPGNPLIQYTWATVNTTGPAPAVEGPGCAALNDTCMVVFGGRAEFADQADVHILCLNGTDRGRWTKVWPPAGAEPRAGTSPDARESAGAAMVKGTSVGLDTSSEVLLVVGGATSTGGTRFDVWAFSLAQASWTRLPDLPLPYIARPLIFTVPGSEANQTYDIVVVQLTSSDASLGLGAFTFDPVAGAWSGQPGAVAGANGTELLQAGATRISGRTWIFGGSSNKVLVPAELTAAEFGFQKGCDPGQEASGIRCLNCSAGTASPGGRGVKCSACPPGKAAALPGASECAACGMGSYAGSPGSTACAACAAGKSTQGLRGADACFDCGPGQVSGVGFSLCALCEIGKFAPQRGTANCSLCPGDLTTQYPGGNDVLQCGCPEGTFQPVEPEPRSGRCTPCPAKMRCPYGSSEASLRSVASGGMALVDSLGARLPYPLVEPKYWTPASDPMSVYRCDDEKHCPGGDPNSCADFLEDQGCAHCQPGYYWNDQVCGKCAANERSKWLFPVLPCFLAFIIITGLYFMFKDPFERWGSWQNSAIALAFIALNHYQVLALVRNVNMELPKSVSTSLQWWAVTEDVLSPFNAECTGFGAYSASIGIKAAAPLGLLVVTLLCYGISWVLSKLAARPGIFMDANRLWNVYFSLIFTFFNGIAAMSLSLFKCQTNPNGAATLAADASLDCYEGEWNSLIAIAALSVAFYCVGSVALFGWAIWSATRNSNFSKRGFQWRWKFLFIKFRSDVHWWALTILARGVVINAGFAFVTLGLGQLYWIMMEETVYLALTVRFMPWRQITANALSIAASVSIIYACALNGIYTEHDESLDGHIAAMAVVISFSPLFWFLALLAYTFLRNWRSKQSGATKGLNYEELAEAAKGLMALDPDAVIKLFHGSGEWDKFYITKFIEVVRSEYLGIEMSNRTISRDTINSRSASGSSAGPRALAELAKTHGVASVIRV